MTEEKKAPVKRAPKKDQNAELLKRVETLEAIIAKMAHYNGGNSPKICLEHGLEPYQPNKKDMHRF